MKAMKARKNYPLRLPNALFKKLRHKADKEALSVNQLLNRIIKQATDEK